MGEDSLVAGELKFYDRRLSPKFKDVFLIILSDVHYGNPLCSLHHFQRTLKWVEDTPNACCVLNGDLCESSLKTSKGEIYKQVGSPQNQRDWMIKTLKPLKSKILGMTTGNHENRIYNEVGIDISSDIATALGVPYRPEGIGLKISYGSGNESHNDKPFVEWGYFTHGYGGARTKSAKAVKIERTSYYLHSTIYGMSHDHVINAAVDVYLMPDPRSSKERDYDGNETGFDVCKVTAHEKVQVKASAYLKWGGYAEFGGFPPVSLRVPPIWLLSPYSKLWALFPDKPHQAVRVGI